MRILVTFALDAEFAPWRKLRNFSTVERTKHASIFENSGGLHKITVLLTGMGTSSVITALQALGSRRDTAPEIVISSGLAGALSERLNLGDLIAPKTTRTLKNDANAQSDPLLLEIAANSGAIVLETMITGTALVSTVAEKARLAFFGDAVEMESAIVLSQFAGASAHLLALRAISDRADEDLPVDLDRCLTPQGSIKPMNLLNQIVRRPANLPHLISFGKQSYAAAQKLARGLENLISAVPAALENASVA
jgi:nucleoside phosphorylase